MNSHWTEFFFFAVMIVLQAIYEQGKHIRAAYSTGSRKRVKVAWQWSALVIAIIVAVGFAVVYWFPVGNDNLSNLTAEDKHYGLITTSVYYVVMGLLLLATPAWQLIKTVRKKAGREQISRHKFDLLVPLGLFVVAFVLLYLLAPSMLYGPYL